MKPRTLIAVAAVSTTAVVAVCCGGTALATLAVSLTGASQHATTVADVCGTVAPVAAKPVAAKAAAGWSAEQTTNAATIVRVGQQLQVPPRGWVIAVATAMQESDLINSRVATDHDSLGLFQQRPSQGWGSPAQVTDPAYAATQFYKHLLAVPGWQQLALTDAAQRVQRSAFPNAYAKHEQPATALVNQVSGGAAHDVATEVGRCANPGEVSAGGWTVPVPGKVISGFRTPQRPTHQGVDLEAPRHSVVRAAAAGTVMKAICDPATIRTVGSCDVDGSPTALGCGWYVDIAHDGGVITRYCHMVVAPLVHAGDRVTAGQQIGWSGTSGNSSGPHLHFEVHTGGDPHASGAVDPIPFMRDKGAPLGGAA